MIIKDKALTTFEIEQKEKGVWWTTEEEESG